MASLPEMNSPGVYIREIDLSQYAAIANTSKIVGVVTLAQNGPINEVTEISNTTTFENTFGTPISAGGIACTEFLKKSSSLKVVRVAGTSAKARSVSLNGTKKSYDPSELSKNVAAIDQSVTLLSKRVSDLQYDGLVITSDNVVHGVLKYVENWTEFSSIPDDQTGNFIAFKLTGVTGTTMTLKKNGIDRPDKTDIAFDPELIIKVDSPSDYLEIIIDGTQTINIKFSDLTLLTKDQQYESTDTIENALIITSRYKGTLYSDALLVSVSPVEEESADKFSLKICRGNDNNVILNKNYTIDKSKASAYFPYVIDDSSTEFVFTLGSQDAVGAITAVEDAVFSTGDNGIDITDEELVAAIKCFDDSENIDLDILAAPGCVSADAVKALVDVAESRKDIVSLIDTPQGLTAQEAADFVNGESTSYPIAKLDTSYAAAYHPWGEITNEYTGTTEWVPPSVGMIAAMGAEYLEYDAWTAPAGQPRLNITIFNKVERNLTRTDRDTLYMSSINPICNYKGQGMTALGQRTLQRSKTATDRLNVRFLLNHIKRLADYSTISFLFTDINDNTFASWSQVIDKVLANIKDRGGMYDYKVTMDWTTVTDEYLNNNIMPGVIQVKPTKSAEFIPIDVIIRNKSDDFS